MPRLIAITDPEDPRLAPYRDIRERDLVGRAGHFIAEGAVVLDVLLRAAPHHAQSLLIAERRQGALKPRLEALPDDIPVYVAPDQVIEAVSGFHVHRGVLALGRRADPVPAEEALAALPGAALALVLIGIANHDNIGGIFRNAAAFGVSLVLLDGACCDPLYRKAIRVSVGGTLLVPFSRLDPDTDVLGLLDRHGFDALALSPAGEGPLHELGRITRAALILGAEGAGLPESILSRARGIRIPMTGALDSLNVATTSGIVLHYLTMLAR